MSGPPRRPVLAPRKEAQVILDVWRSTAGDAVEGRVGNASLLGGVPDAKTAFALLVAQRFGECFFVEEFPSSHRL